MSARLRHSTLIAGKYWGDPSFPTSDTVRLIRYPQHPSGLVIVSPSLTIAASGILPKPRRALLGVVYEMLFCQNRGGSFYGSEKGYSGPDTEAMVLLSVGGIISRWFGPNTSNSKMSARIRAECVEMAEGQYVWACSGVAVGITYNVSTTTTATEAPDPPDRPPVEVTTLPAGDPT
jgi:hypothetical protein